MIKPIITLSEGYRRNQLGLRIAATDGGFALYDGGELVENGDRDAIISAYNERLRTKGG